VAPPPKKDKERNLLAEATKEMNAGKYGRAAALLKDLVAAEPKNIQARRLFATLHLKTGNLITAKAAFEALVKTALEAQDYWLAESLLREYLTAGPRYVPFLERLGQILEAKGDSAAAVMEYGRAIEVLVEDPDPDNPNRAKELFEKAERLAPTSRVVAKWQATFAPPAPASTIEPPQPEVVEAPSTVPPFPHPEPSVPPPFSPVTTPPPPMPMPAEEPVRPASPGPRPGCSLKVKNPAPSPVEPPVASPVEPPAPSAPSASPPVIPPFRFREPAPASSVTDPASQTAPRKALSLEELLAQVSEAEEELGQTEQAVPLPPALSEATTDVPPVVAATSATVEEPMRLAPERGPVEDVPVESAATAVEPHPVVQEAVQQPAIAADTAPLEESAFKMDPSPPPVLETGEWGRAVEPVPTETPAEFAPQSSPAVEAPPGPETPSSPVAAEGATGPRLGAGPVEPPVARPSMELRPGPVEPPAPEPPTPPLPEPVMTAPPPPEPAPPSDVVYSSPSSSAEPAPYVPWTPTQEEAAEEAQRESAVTRNFFQQEALAVASTESTAEERPRPRMAETVRPAARRPAAPRLGMKVAVQVKSWLASAGAATKTAVVLAVMVIVLSIVSLGGATLAWLVMEEQPTGNFHQMTQPPARTVQDPNRNGYFLLLGFGESAGGDPVRSGYSVWQSGGAGMTHWCFGSGPTSSGPLRFPPETAALADMWDTDDPAKQFTTQATAVRGWMARSGPLMSRYRQWLAMPFDDWGYGFLGSPDCGQILTAHRLYVADAFTHDLSTGFDRLESELVVWRRVMGDARTLSVKILAVTVVNEDLMVVAGLLNRAEFDNRFLPRITNLARSLDSFERAMKWPIQNELAVSVKLVDKAIKPESVADRPFIVRVLTHLPLPRQRMLNGYAEYLDSLIRVGEAPPQRLPKLYDFAQTPAQTPIDYVANPIENVLGEVWLPDFADLTGRVVETEARLRLVGLLERIRRPSFDPNVVARIAKAGQGFFDPFTDIPMLFSDSKRRLYSVGRDRQDNNGDPKRDVSVPITMPLQ